jgi:tetratricopeptide (TPR) repeat protein
MLRGPQQVQWLNRLEAELGNLRAILRWAFAHDHAALGLRLAGALDRFWQYHTHVTEGRQWLMRGLARDGAAPIVRAKALALAGWLARFQDEMPKAEALLTESLALYRELDDRRGIAEVTDTLGDLAHFRGDQETARALHERNLALRRELGDRWGMAMSLNSLGWIALAQNDHRRAMMSLQESLAIVRQLRDARGIAMVLTGLGWASLDRDDARQAHVCMRESLILFRGLRSKIDICLCLDGLAAVAGMRGDAERAARFFGAADTLHTAMNVDYAPITERHYARHRDAAREKIGAAAWSVAWEAGRALPLDQAIDEALSAGAADDGTAPRME